MTPIDILIANVCTGRLTLDLVAGLFLGFTFRVLGRFLFITVRQRHLFP